MRSAGAVCDLRLRTVKRNIARCRDLVLIATATLVDEDDAPRAISAYNRVSALVAAGELSLLSTYAFDRWIKSLMQSVDASDGGVAIPRSILADLTTIGRFAEESPSSSLGGIESHLLRAISADPPPIEADDIVELDDGWRAEEGTWLGQLKAASTIIAARSDAAALAESFVGALVPIHNRTGFAHKSTSIAAFPGTIFLSKPPSVEMCAEAIVHEADHQYLYQLTDDGLLLAQSAENSREIYRSPWRPDPRPAHGLLFGASAFSRVAACFVESVERTESLGRRATLAALQALDAVQTLGQHCKFTPKGKAFLRELQDEIDATLSRLRAEPAWDAWNDEAQRLMSGAQSDWTAGNKKLLGETSSRARSDRPAPH